MENQSTPLADYFWIAGIESISYNDSPPPTPHVDATIVEDGEPEPVEPIQGSSKATARHSRQGSSHRISKLSADGRFPSHMLDDLDGSTRSNRSSTTIRPVNGNHEAKNCSNADHAQDGEFDFDTALFKFAAERENFLEDLSFSAGAKLQTRPPMVNPRAERIKADENEAASRRSPLRNIKGSIRRKMSFRDMNSSRKQPAIPRAGMSAFAHIFTQSRPTCSPSSTRLLRPTG